MLSHGSCSVIISRAASLEYPDEKWQAMLQSLVNQKYIQIQKIFVLELQPKVTAYVGAEEHVTETIAITTIRCPHYGIGLDLAREHLATDFALWIHSPQAPVILKESACFTFGMAFLRDPQAGLAYSDYTVISPNGIQERQLLEYHRGRVRDNLDLGVVFALKTSIFQKIMLPKNLQYAAWYDVRLQMSEHAEIKHIGNRFAGSLYQVEKMAQGHNVFDYLQDDQMKQMEMETVLSQHLARIGAYLPPDFGHHPIVPSASPKPKAISIIIPVYRRPEFIGTAIESALQQTLPDIEIIVVVNGGADDPTAQVVKEYMENGAKYQANAPQVHLIVTDINNIGLCLNLGLLKSTAQYYLQLDSDDRLKPYAAAMVFETFQQNPNLGMVIGSYEVWEKRSDGTLFRRQDIPVVKHEEWTRSNGRNNLLRINGAGAPRAYNIQVVQELGWFSINDEPYAKNYGEDYDMVLKISEQYAIARIWEPIYEVVRHSGSTDHSIDQATIDRNDNAKDMMRWTAIERRKKLLSCH